jgi:hypothetical protein
MLSCSNARPRAWREIVASVVTLFAFASAGLAQQNQSDKAQKTTTAPQADKAPKDSAEAQKARAEVKALHEQMSKLHEQMHATREKMHKAWVHLAEVEGWQTKGFVRDRGWRRHGMGFANWGGPGPRMRGPWVRFHNGEMVHHGNAAGQDINARLQHMQDEIDALRRQLQKQGNPRQER